MERGQALLEYILLLLLVTAVAGELISGMSEEAGTKFGNLAHVLSLNLSTGTCEQDCFFQGYVNGYSTP